MAAIGVSVRKTDSKGKGLFADVDFNDGDIILTEKPLVSCQFSWNKAYNYSACDYCLKSLETAEESCRRLAQDDSIILPYKNCCDVDKAKHTPCELCGIKYCSVECKEKAKKEYHPVICLNDANPLKHELEMLEDIWKQIHYPPETASVMILARMVALVKLAHNKDSVALKLKSFCHRTEDEENHIIHKLLGEKFSQQIESVRLPLKSAIYEDSIADWFSVNGFKSMLALLGTNQQGIGSSSLSTWVRNCDDLELSEEDRSKLNDFLEDLYEKIDEVSGEFLDCEGVGLYTLQSSCNHSCEPNAEVAFENGDNTLSLRAIKPIVGGHEICISYLGECNLTRSRHSRQKFLSENYLFFCHCHRCEDEKDDTDVTSDSEEYSDSN